SVPVMETLFSWSNLFIVFVLLFSLPFLNRLLLKSREGLEIQNPVIDFEGTSSFETEYVEQEDAVVFSDRLENSRIISIIIGLLGIIYVVYHFYSNGFDLNLNIVNFTMLFLVILLHDTTIRFLHSVAYEVKIDGGIIVEFTLYVVII